MLQDLERLDRDFWILCHAISLQQQAKSPGKNPVSSAPAV